MTLPDEQKRKLLARLRRAEGQVGAVRRMLESDACCTDTLTQLSAARGALAKVGEAVLQHHVEACLAEASQADGSDARQEKVDEAMLVVSRYGLGRG